MCGVALIQVHIFLDSSFRLFFFFVPMIEKTGSLLFVLRYGACIYERNGFQERIGKTIGLVWRRRREGGKKLGFIQWALYILIKYIYIDSTYLHLHSDLISPPIAFPFAFLTSRYHLM